MIQESYNIVLQSSRHNLNKSLNGIYINLLKEKLMNQTQQEAENKVKKILKEIASRNHLKTPHESLEQMQQLAIQQCKRAQEDSQK
jgi:hypothetical protein